MVHPTNDASKGKSLQQKVKEKEKQGGENWFRRVARAFHETESSRMGVRYRCPWTSRGNTWPLKKPAELRNTVFRGKIRDAVCFLRVHGMTSTGHVKASSKSQIGNAFEAYTETGSAGNWSKEFVELESSRSNHVLFTFLRYFCEFGTLFLPFRSWKSEIWGAKNLKFPPLVEYSWDFADLMVAILYKIAWKMNEGVLLVFYKYVD